MTLKATVSIDVSDMAKALDFYIEALECNFKKKYSDNWQVVSVETLDIHIQQKATGTIAAAEHKRDYTRHWSPVHLDFIVDEIDPICAEIENLAASLRKKLSQKSQISRTVRIRLATDLILSGSN